MTSENDIGITWYRESSIYSLFLHFNGESFSTDYSIALNMALRYEKRNPERYALAPDIFLIRFLKRLNS